MNPFVIRQFCWLFCLLVAQVSSKNRFCFRAAAADTFAMVVFCFISGMLIEVLVSGMTLEQSLASRLLSIPVNIAIAYPYGVFRDWVLKRGAAISPTPWMKNVADLVAYVSFQSPVYATILFVVGASPEQIVTAVSSNAIISCAMGVLYGYFLDFCRRCFKVPGYVPQV